MVCFNCEKCFGCVGLQHKKFCIFNKQYTEDDYWTRLDEIKCAMLDRGEYGSFFPLSMAPGYFPDSGAAMFFGCSQEVGYEKLGALKFDPESEGAIGTELSDTTKLRPADQVPDCIDLFDEATWVGIPILDTKRNRRFAYLRPEIEFYRKQRLGPPKDHHISRLQELFLQANHGDFQLAQCEKCRQQIQVAVNLIYKNRRLHCQACYLKHLEQNG